MKIIATCGHPHSNYQTIGRLLNKAGIAEANPSRKEKQTPQDIQDQIFRMYDLDREEISITRSPSLGNICQEFANDLFMSNLSQKQWGWADSKTTWLLDFWKEYEPQTRFVLVYASPELSLANMLHQQIANPSDLSSILQSWYIHNTELIRFYNHHSKHCVLVNVQMALQQPSQFIDRVSSKLNIKIEVGSKSQEISTKTNDNDFSPQIATQLAKGFLNELTQESYSKDECQDILLNSKSKSHIILKVADEQSEKNTELVSNNASLSISDLNQQAIALYQELESSADFPHSQQELSIEDRIQAFKDYNQLVLTQKTLKKELVDNQKMLTGEKQKAKELEQENELMLLQLHQVQEELECKFLEQKNLKSQLDDTSDKLKKELAHYKNSLDAEKQKKQQSNKELEQENELMLLQLHQVQEELEHYFLKNQELQVQLKDESERPAAEVEKRVNHEINSITIDLKKENISGENWYYAEQDGRWAGPEKLSTIQLPNLEHKGEYQITLNIVDAIQENILDGLQLSINDNPLDITYKKQKRSLLGLLKKKNTYPKIATAIFNTDTISNSKEWLLQLAFPSVVSPADLGQDKDDLRKLSIRMKSVQLEFIG